MKKIALSLAVLFSVALVSCGGNKAENDSDTIDSTVITEEVAGVVETDTADTTAVVAAEVAETPAETPAE